MIEVLRTIIEDILSEPSLLIGLISLIGLLALRKSFNKVIVGTLKPILGFLMLSAGGDFIVSNLNPLGQMIEHGFNITGVIPSNEAVVALAQDVLGKETMFILLLGLIVNVLIARFTKYKYIFLSGNHSFFMACLLSAVLSSRGVNEGLLILIGGIILGAWSALSPAIGQKYTLKVTGGENIALAHFGSLGYYISAFVGGLVGNPKESTEEIKVPEKFDFIRDATIATAITMVIFYLIAALAAGPSFVSGISGGTNFIIFAIMSGLKFAVGVTIVYSGIQMILAELIPAFEGISGKFIPNAVAAVDCAVFFSFAPTAVIIGFIFSFLGGIVGMLILGFAGGVLIIPGLVAHFFCGATAGVYGNATGGRKGAAIGSFVNGLAITFMPAMLLPVLENLGFKNTTFSDFDFAFIGVILGKTSELFGNLGIYLLTLVTILILIIPNFIKTGSDVINNRRDIY